jgi:hypothetical protein
MPGHEDLNLDADGDAVMTDAVVKQGEPRDGKPFDVFGNTMMSGAGFAGTAKGEKGKEPMLNAYDPKYSVHDWETEPNLGLYLPLEEEPVTCEDICKKKHREADEKCSVARKRVELGLRKAGCPSKVLALRRKTPCGPRTSKKKLSTKRKLVPSRLSLLGLS